MAEIAYLGTLPTQIATLLEPIAWQSREGRKPGFPPDKPMQRAARLHRHGLSNGWGSLGDSIDCSAWMTPNYRRSVSSQRREVNDKCQIAQSSFEHRAILNGSNRCSNI